MSDSSHPSPQPLPVTDVDSEATAELPVRRQWAVLLVLLCPVLIISVDNTVLGFAVPHLSESLQPSSTQLLWIVDIYAFILAGLLVLMGNIGDRIGRKRLLLIGATAFGAASVLAAYSTTPEMLIAARALLGVAGATLMPSTLSLVRSVFLDPGRRKVAIALWTSTFAVGSAIGPIVGGWLLEHAWWGSVFLLAIPFMVILLVAGSIIIPESRNPNPGKFDWISGPLSILAIIPLVWVLKTVTKDGLTWSVTAVALFGAIMAVVFIRRQRVVEEPMLDLKLFGYRPFSVAITVNLLCNFAFVGGIFIIAQFLQYIPELDSFTAGLYLLPAMALSIVASLGTVALNNRGVSFKALLTIAMGFVSAGYFTATFLATDQTPVVVAFLMVLVGMGTGGATSLSSNLVLSSVPVARAGAASAISETAFELGAASGIAILGSALNLTYTRQFFAPPELSQPQAEIAADTIASATDLAQELPPSVGAQVVDAAQEAFTAGTHTAGYVGAALMALGVVMIVMFLGNINNNFTSND